MALQPDPVSLGFDVNVRPPFRAVQPGDTATFNCHVVTEEPISYFSWQMSPSVPPGRYSYDNNQKTLRIRKIKTRENNLEVTCTVTGVTGREASASGHIAILLNDEEDGGGGDEDENPPPRPRPTRRRLTTKVHTTSTNQPTTTKIQPKPTSNDGMLTRKRVTTIGYNLPMSTTKRSGSQNRMSLDKSSGLNPAVLGTIVAITGIIAILFIIFIVRRVRQKRNSTSKSQTAAFARAHTDVQFKSRSGYNGGYEDTPNPPMAPTIDTRHSQTPDVIPAGHNQNGRNAHIPKYAKPFHKSSPSVYSTPKIDDDEEYEYMEPGAEVSARSSTMSGMSLGKGYDHLARSQPEGLNKLVATTKRPNSTPKDYGKLTTGSNHPHDSPGYENQGVARKHMFELQEDGLKYATLTHDSDGSQSSLTRPKPKTPYAKIRGVLKILRTQHSTRVNIEPC